MVIPIPKKGDLKKCSNYITLSLICHSSDILLKIILKRLTPQAEQITYMEQARFRKGRSTVEQITNVRTLKEKHLGSQTNLFHNFIDFRKAFDRVYHEGLWSTLQKCGIDHELITMIKALYNNNSSSVLISNNIGNSFKSTVGVRQGCILSPLLFNIYLEEIMSEVQDDITASISIGGRLVWNLTFSDEIDLIAGTNNELQYMTNQLSKCASGYGMEISSEKNNADITLNDNKLEEVNKLCYLGATLSKDGSCETAKQNTTISCDFSHDTTICYME